MPGPDRKRRLTAFVVAMAALIVTPLAVVASDRFNDVPDSNIFHDDIAWLADNDVTRGCNPPDNDEFCPSDNVTRQQMAAFMRRLAENEVVNAATANEADHAADADTLDGLDSTELQTHVAGTARATNVGTVNTIDLAAGTAASLGTLPVTTASGSHFAALYGFYAGNNEAAVGRIAGWLQFDNSDCTLASAAQIEGGTLTIQALTPSVWGSLHGSFTAPTAGVANVTFCALSVTTNATVEDSSFSLVFGNTGSSDVSTAGAPSSGELPPALIP